MTQPNLVLLNNALAQTGWASSKLTERNWKEIVRTRIGQIDWAQASKDVMPFLEREKDIALLTRENCLRLLRG